MRVKRPQQNPAWAAESQLNDASHGALVAEAANFGVGVKDDLESNGFPGVACQ